MPSYFSKKWKQAQEWVKSAGLQAIRTSLLTNGVKASGRRVLCVDDDRSFCKFLQRLAYSLGIQLDSAYSIENAKRVIEDNPDYNAYIIDGHLPDGSGFELVAWIREKKEPAIPIGFISRIYQDAKSFRLLKEKLKVDYVLDKPIRAAEAHRLLIQLCRLEISPSDQDPFSNDLLEELKGCYQKTIPDKIELLEKLILIVDKSPSLDNLQNLRNEVHKIAGSAGSYGYMSVSELCKNLELNLIEQIDLAKKGLMNYQWLLALEEFFTQIKLHFQIELPESDSTRAFRTQQLPSIYLVDEDQEMVKGLIQFSHDYHFELLAETRPDKAMQTLMSADFYPQTLLLNARYQSTALTGNDLLKAFYETNDYLTSVISFLVNKNCLDDLLNALKSGITCIVEKPFNPSLVFPLLDQTPFRALPLHFNILVTGIDSDTCEYILKTLKYSGIKAQSLHDFNEIEDKIKSFQPDLILLDIDLADKLGIQIIERLRKKLNYKKSLVGILTVTTKEDFSEAKYFEAGLDSIIFKPIDKSLLQRKIAGLLKKQADETLATAQDSMMGLESIHTLKRYLSELQLQATAPFPKILVLFEVEAFDSLEHQVKKKVLTGISQSLANLLKKYEMAAYLEEGRFAFVFQGCEPHYIQLFIRSYLHLLHEHLSHIVKESTLRINQSLAILSAEEKIEDLLRRSAELLRLARGQSDNPVNLIMEPTFIPLKEVCIFQDEACALGNMQKLFEQQGFKVSLYTEIERDFFRSINPLPLLLLTGSFADAKGLSLLKKWSMKNLNQVPVICFSQLLDEKEIREFLEALDYFKAPFSLVIIISHAAS